MKLLRHPLSLITACILLFIVASGALRYAKYEYTIKTTPTLPAAETYTPPSPILEKPKNPTATPSPTDTNEPDTSLDGNTLPDEINLSVPFTSQAPHKKWDLPYKEFCEEASTFMASSYIKGTSIPSPEFADAELLKIKAFEEQRFGFYEDTNAEQTSIILKEYFGIDRVKVVYDPTATMIRDAVAHKQLVLVPAEGTLLGNPHFRHPGPPYHMVVVKGYTKTGQFITNDPGTQFGADYLYAPDVLMNAMHDWNGGDVINGKKVILIVG